MSFKIVHYSKKNPQLWVFLNSGSNDLVLSDVNSKDSGKHNKKSRFAQHPSTCLKVADRRRKNVGWVLLVYLINYVCQKLSLSWKYF